MKKIYIAGAGGMLGNAIFATFKADFKLRCTDIDLNENWLSHLDFRDYHAYYSDVVNFGPDYLIHLGALTDLEYCEMNVADAYQSNTLSVEHAVHIANKLNIPLVYVSTAGIFDGSQNVYDDWSLPNPLGHYARSKYQGECYVRENTYRHIIVRAGWMMGGGPKKDKKFINKVCLKLRSGCRELYVVNDRLGTPTYTYDFAKNLKLLLETELWGVYNLVCQGQTSRLEVVSELLQILGYTDSVEVIEVSSDYFRLEYFAPRPKSECLENRKLELRGLDCMRHWKVALKEYLIDSYADLIARG